LTIIFSHLSHLSHQEVILCKLPMLMLDVGSLTKLRLTNPLVLAIVRLFRRGRSKPFIQRSDAPWLVPTLLDSSRA